MDASVSFQAGQTASTVTGRQVYDSIMASIEPELLSHNIQHLDEAYVNETEDAKKERYARYSRAYDAYDIAYAAWHASLQTTVAEYRRNALRSAEAQSRSEEESVLTKIVADIETFVPSPAA